MNGWVKNGRMDGGVDGWRSGWVNHMGGWEEGRLDRGMDRWMDKQDGEDGNIRWQQR